MKGRHSNHGVRKVCRCARRLWPKCSHPWHFNFKIRGGPSYRFSLDKHLNRHIDSKTEAQAEAAIVKAAIRAGTFGRLPARKDMTLRQLADRYYERHVLTERPASAKRWSTQVAAICRRFLAHPTGGSRVLGDWPVEDISTDTIEVFQELRREAGIFAMNRDLGVLRAVFNLGVAKGLIETTPFRRGGVSTIKRAAEARRSRRLEAGEGERLLAACGPHLRPLAEAAIETGCRRGELLTLQWSQVRLDGPRPALILTAAKTKTKTLREVPISVRLRAILEMRRDDPDGKRFPMSAYVFGDAAGGQVKTIKRAWASARLRAHGFKPEYVKGTARLTETCLEHLHKIDLHFHDLRREAGSRWLDMGVPLHSIQRWLGHTNISQTSTYLSVTDSGSHEAMTKFDAALEAYEALQRLATEAGKGDQNGPQEGMTEDSKPHESAASLH